MPDAVRGVVRPYRSSDRDGVLGVWAEASAGAHPFLSEEFLELERRRIPAVYLPKAETWVWEADGRVVGFLSLLGSEVGALFVAPSIQGSGIGRALMDRARALRGELEVEVFTRNEHGRSFYAKYGFERICDKVHEETGFEVTRLRLAASAPQEQTRPPRTP